MKFITRFAGTEQMTELPDNTDMDNRGVQDFILGHMVHHVAETHGENETEVFWFFRKMEKFNPTEDRQPFEVVRVMRDGTQVGEAVGVMFTIIQR